jgi:hypothetical protein
VYGAWYMFGNCMSTKYFNVPLVFMALRNDFERAISITRAIIRGGPRKGRLRYIKARNKRLRYIKILISNAGQLKKVSSVP